MAARGINKVIVLGNLGKDPEMRYLPNGDAVANFTVATSETWKDKQTGEQKEQTEWHRIVAFRRLGEICGEYLRKGSKIYVEGRLQTRKWQNQQGQDVYTTEIVANEMQMLDSRGQGGGMGGGQGGGYQGGGQGGQGGGFQPQGGQQGGGFQPQGGQAAQAPQSPQSPQGGGQGGFQGQGGQQGGGFQPQGGGQAPQGGGFQPQGGGFQPQGGQAPQGGGFQPQGGQGGGQASGGFKPPAPQGGQGAQPQGGGFKPQNPPQAEPPIDFDDDIPF